LGQGSRRKEKWEKVGAGWTADWLIEGVYHLPPPSPVLSHIGDPGVFFLVVLSPSMPFNSKFMLVPQEWWPTNGCLRLA
jgi:hypothetical protein